MPALSEQSHYADRRSKPAFVARHYGKVLEGSILDVGSDGAYFREVLPPDARYTSLGLGNASDVRHDLEDGPLPAADGSYDTVLCLDTLEHLEHIHRVFDELCRVARRSVLVSLPNPWLGLVGSVALRSDRSMKFYGLPTETPDDRHRWFFNAEEAERFVRERAARNGFRVTRLEFEGERLGRAGWRRRLATTLLGLVPGLRPQRFLRGTLWAVLEREEAAP